MLIVTNILSLDGYVAAADGDPSALPMDDAFNSYNLERVEAAGTLLLGANSYRGFSGHWPAVLDDPDGLVDRAAEQLGVDRDVVAGRMLDGTNLAIAARNRDIAKVVVSDSLEADELGPWAGSTTLLRRAEAHERIAALDGEVLVLGSRTLWNWLLAEGLVDELHLMVGPVALGKGVSAFDGPVPGLRLLGTRRFEGSENVLLRYAVDR